MLMQGACQNMGWKIEGRWCVIPPESFRTGSKEASWYLQLLLDSNSLSVIFGRRGRGIYLAFTYKHLPLRQSVLAKGLECVCRELHPIAKASTSSLTSGDPSLSPSLFLYFLPPFFHCSSFFESKRYYQHPTPTAFLCPRSGCEPVSSPGHSLMEEEQSCSLRCQDSTGT